MMSSEQICEMNTDGRVSVIIPVYNVEDYLDACLASVTRQTFADLEILLINDGSTDRSGEKCREWQAADPRIVVAEQENKGLSAARNRGIELSSAPYLAFVDPDDVVEPDLIERLYRALQTNRADLAVSFIDPVGQPHRKRTPLPERLDRQEAMELMLGGRLPVCAVAKLYRKALIGTLRFPEGRVYEDVCYAYRVLEQCRTIAVVDRALYHYVIRRGSITQTHSLKNLLDFAEASRLEKTCWRRYAPENAEGLLYKDITDWMQIEYRIGCLKAEDRQAAELAELRQTQQETRESILARKALLPGCRRQFGWLVPVKYTALRFFPRCCSLLMRGKAAWHDGRK